MARNIEIKSRIDSIDSIVPAVTALADSGPFEIAQDDTFFACERGRLKLRMLSQHEGQLIFYRRGDRKGPKESSYIITPTTSPGTLRESLSLAYGEVGHVRKKRTLYLAGRTRVHLDRVEGLGDFLELEVVLEEGESAETGEAIAQGFMQKLGLSPDQLIEGAYIDLLGGAGASFQ